MTNKYGSQSITPRSLAPSSIHSLSVSRQSIPIKLPSLSVVKTKGYPGIVMNDNSQRPDCDSQLTSRSLDGHIRHLDRLDTSDHNNNLHPPIETLEHNEYDDVTLRTMLTKA